MSFYCEHEGEIKFKKKEDYFTCKRFLIEAEWATKDSWLDECGSQLGNDSPFTDKLLTIEFYGFCQRNIHRFFGWFEEQKFEWEGKVVGASTDGCFEGWIIQPNEEEIYDDLDEWATLKGLGERPDDEDEASEWQEDIIRQYLENPYVEPENSVKFITEDIPKKPSGRNPKELFQKAN